MKAYLIDPYERKVTEVNYDGDYKSISKLIGCENITVGAIFHNKEEDAVYVDDEGLLSLTDESKFFTVDNSSYSQPLAGKGLVLGCDDEGETIEPSISISLVREWVRYLNIEDAKTYRSVARFV